MAAAVWNRLIPSGSSDYGEEKTDGMASGRQAANATGSLMIGFISQDECGAAARLFQFQGNCV